MVGLRRSMRCSVWCAAGLLSGVSAQAAEGFQVRYNIAGSLGGEMFAPADLSGWVGGVALTHVHASKITGADGGDFRATLPGGQLPLSSNTALNPTFGRSAVQVIGTGAMNLLNVGVAYSTAAEYGGGRWVWGLNIPYATTKQNVRNVGATPALNWPTQGAPSAAVQSQVTQQFGASYQQELSAAAAAQNGTLEGLGDIEVLAGWAYRTEQFRTVAGLNLVLPTGQYNSATGIYIGGRNFYTVRPGGQLVYLPTPKVAVAGKVSLGFNSRNEDTGVRSGNWASLETALGYFTPLGPVGLHWIRVQQFHDDVDNPLGPNRLRMNNFGAFLTTKVPGQEAALTLQYMHTANSKFAKSGTFTQIRFSKTF